MLPYLVGADLVNTGLAAVLSFSDRVIYPSYAAGPRVFGISALRDQAAAGALMWVIGSIFYLVPLAAIAIRLLSPQSRRPAAVTLRQGSIAVPHSGRRFDLLNLPLIGRLLRWRYGRMALQSVAFAAAVLVIADGFLGHSMGAMNLAGVLPWTYVRAFGVIALLVLGNIFCLSCPFMLPRELGHRLGLARFRWPRWLRSKWIAIALLILFFWSYEAFAIWDHPQRTAWLLIAYFAAAFLVDTFFRGANFCKYICPLGQFNFAGSLFSPFTLEAKSHSTCERCTTHDCIAGNAQQRGCELQLYMPQKAGNMDCTLCMDCVKACPHDNIGLFAIAPVHDILRDPVRSSIGKFSSRIDIAALVLVLVLAAFVNAWWMVTPGTLGKYLALAVLLAAAAAALSFANRSTKKELFCRFSQALLPLGLAMWAAHLLFHLITGWATLDPALHQAAADLGWHLFAPAHWRMEQPLLPANTLLSVQLLLLDAGLLLTLYLGWRLARQWATSAGRAAPADAAVGNHGGCSVWCGRLDHAPTDADARRHDEPMKALYPLAAFLMLTMGATAARADGGAMLLHQDAGAFTITLFAAPQPLHTGDADLSVMVQDRSNGEVLLDPVIDLTVAPATARRNAANRSARERAGEQSALAGIHGAFLQRRQVAHSAGRSPGQRHSAAEHGVHRRARSLPRYPGMVLCSAACGHHLVIRHPPGFEASVRGEGSMIHAPNPLIAMGVVASTAATDAVYVLFTAAVSARRRVVAASWSSVWYLLSAFAVISYTGNPIYVAFAAIGSWLGAFGAVTWLGTAAKPHT